MKKRLLAFDLEGEADRKGGLDRQGKVRSGGSESGISRAWFGWLTHLSFGEITVRILYVVRECAGFRGLACWLAAGEVTVCRKG